MNDTLAYIIDKWGLDIQQETPIEIPDTNRVMLACLFAELDYRTGAEIGVARGNFSFLLVKHNPKVKLYCVDGWSVYDGLHDYTDPEVLKEFYMSARYRLKPYDDRVQFINKLSMDAVKEFDDESLDFVYIDANHEWPYVTQDIFYWAEKVKPGGIISGHDYLWIPRKDGMVQVAPAVHGYTEAFDINPWFLIGERHQAQSWLWVKE